MGAEAVILIKEPSNCRTDVLDQQENHEDLKVELDLIEEKREQAAVIAVVYQ